METRGWNKAEVSPKLPPLGVRAGRNQWGARWPVQLPGWKQSL